MDSDREQNDGVERPQRWQLDVEKAIHTKESPSEPAKKRRKIVDDSDEEGVKAATIPSKGDANGNPAAPVEIASTKIANEPTAESPPSGDDSDPTGEDEPELDPQSEKKAAAKLYFYPYHSNEGTIGNLQRRHGLQVCPSPTLRCALLSIPSRPLQNVSKFSLI
jgi:hypothetical protein